MISIKDNCLHLNHLKITGPKDQLLKLLKHILALIENEVVNDKDTLLMYVGDVVNQMFVYYSLVETESCVYVQVSCALGTVHLESNAYLNDMLRIHINQLSKEIKDVH